MGIRADDHVSRHGQPFLRQQGVLDAHLSHLKIVRDLVPTGELPDAFAMLRGLDVFIRHKMIRHKSYLVLVEHALCPELVHLLDCHRAGDVIAQHQIQIRFDQLSRLYLVKPCGSGQNLLRHCHSHIRNSCLSVKCLPFIITHLPALFKQNLRFLFIGFADIGCNSCLPVLCWNHFRKSVYNPLLAFFLGIVGK